MSESATPDILSQPLQFLKGIGPKRAAALQRCGLVTVADAMNYFPYRHEDRRSISRVSHAADGEYVTVCGVVDTVASRRTRSYKTIVQVGIRDDTGVLYGIWFNQPWMEDKFRKGQQVLFSGKFQFAPFPSINNPSVEILPDDFESGEYEGTLIPVYRLTEDISAYAMRKIVRAALEVGLPAIEEYFPRKVCTQYNLIALPDAYAIIHAYDQPADQLDALHLSRARRRLVLDEFFTITMGLLLKRRHTEHMPYSLKHSRPGTMVRDFINSLPFSLTAAQKRVLKEITDDLVSPHAMNRLLQGDVGSGKTVVAVIAMLTAVESGYQAALMAPTEVLARQHFATISSFLKDVPVPVHVLTGSTRGRERKEIIASLAAGDPQIIIGTHAIIQEGVELPRLGLAVVDEQHKFGVMQRNRLRDQSEQPDVLVMTATPIPRSLALTVYGDLSNSILDEMPRGRQPIKTYVIKPDRLKNVWEFIRKQVHEGHQAYVVYPLIDESDKMPLKAATSMYEHLSRDVFPELQVGLIHGRVSADEKDRIMGAFSNGSIHILVSTTVIEVGIDVPNATIMVIEEAHRFGLAQLHQLRGRIGRGSAASYCILVDNSPENDITAEPSVKRPSAPEQPELLETYMHSRLAVMAQTNDGFRIAEEDLKMRGPGEFFGIEQTGIPALHIADLIEDEEELTLARHLAETLLSYRDQLTSETREKLRRRLQRAFGTRIRGVDAG
jgi:ATP-dependent DNA helicase RecG